MTQIKKDEPSSNEITKSPQTFECEEVGRGSRPSFEQTKQPMDSFYYNGDSGYPPPKRDMVEIIFGKVSIIGIWTLVIGVLIFAVFNTISIASFLSTINVKIINIETTIQKIEVMIQNIPTKK